MRENLTENQRLRMHTLWDIAQTDTEYKQMLAELREMEKKYELSIEKLPDEDRDALCDFVSQCEAMSWRVLEIAAEKMIFRFERE